MSPEAESILTIKKYLGLDEGQAKFLLSTPLSLTINDQSEAALHFRDFLQEMLSKTFSNISINSKDDCVKVEVVIGNSSPIYQHTIKIYVQWNEDCLSIATEPSTLSSEYNLHQVFLKLGAAYTCGAVICKSTLQGTLGLGEKYPIILKFKNLFGEHLEFLKSSVFLDEMHLAGMGATGTWFTDTISLMDVEGKINIYDDDIVSPGNLQRTTFLKSQIGFKKVLAYQQTFFPINGNLTLIPNTVRFPQDPKKLHEKVITCVDSRIARRKIQDFAPKKTFDCSTTDITEISLFFGELASGKACLSCLYYESETEDGRLKDIASSLGVTLEDVKSERISKEAAVKIVIKYPMLNSDNLIGIAYDSFIKELCGQGKLQASNSESLAEDTLAPLCHVSAIAGIFLAIEIVRRHYFNLTNEKWNYWKINPWTSPSKALRVDLKVNEKCVFHNYSLDAALSIWDVHAQKKATLKSINKILPTQDSEDHDLKKE